MSDATRILFALHRVETHIASGVPLEPALRSAAAACGVDPVALALRWTERALAREAARRALQQPAPVEDDDA